jgi:hypothetical protein
MIAYSIVDLSVAADINAGGVKKATIPVWDGGLRIFRETCSYRGGQAGS